MPRAEGTGAGRYSAIWKPRGTSSAATRSASAVQAARIGWGSALAPRGQRWRCVARLAGAGCDGGGAVVPTDGHRSGDCRCHGRRARAEADAARGGDPSLTCIGARVVLLGLARAWVQRAAAWVWGAGLHGWLTGGSSAAGRSCQHQAPGEVARPAHGTCTVQAGDAACWHAGTHAVPRSGVHPRCRPVPATTHRTFATLRPAAPCQAAAWAIVHLVTSHFLGSKRPQPVDPRRLSQ